MTKKKKTGKSMRNPKGGWNIIMQVIEFLFFISLGGMHSGEVARLGSATM